MCLADLQKHIFRFVNYFDCAREAACKAIVQEFENRVLWGTDWPHPNMKSHMPDDGALVDYIPQIADTSAQRQKLLVTNPMRLYWA